MLAVRKHLFPLAFHEALLVTIIRMSLGEGTKAAVASTSTMDDYWAKPEDSVPHARFVVEETVSLEVIDRAFPDFNCDRVESGKWQRLRWMLEALISSGFGMNSPTDLLQWDHALQSAESLHGISGWLYPWLGAEWVAGAGVSQLVRNRSATVHCPLGIATVMTISIVLHLAKVYQKIVAGSDHDLSDWFGENLRVKTKAFQSSLMRIFQDGKIVGDFIWALLPATRWPILDLLAAAEKHLLHRVRKFAVSLSLFPEPPPCLPELSPRFEYLIEFAGQLSRSGWHDPSANVAVKILDESIQINRLIRRMENTEVIQWGNQDQCGGRELLYELLKAFSYSQGQNMMTKQGNPEMIHLPLARSLLRTFWDPAVWIDNVIILDFASFHIFGFWLQLRRLCMHRLELPASSSQLALAFAAPSQNHVFSGRGRSSGLHDALYSLDASISAEKIVFLTACWGAAHARTLVLWLRAARRAFILGVTVVMCHDTIALAACEATHDTPSLCADVRDWPKTLISKLVGALFCLESGFDMMWLDLDTIVLHDPRPSLRDALRDGPSLSFLISVESDSWNCVNAGVFFMKSTLDCRRYLGHWISLFLLRPFTIDQNVLILLLHLIPSMDYADFAKRTGLLMSSSPSVQALGTLRTPSWRALDAREQFCMTDIMSNGGFVEGKQDSVVVLHMLSSWPNYSIFNPIYHDVPDVTGDILQALDESNRGRAFELVGRSGKTDWSERRQNCRTKYRHGR